MIDSNRARYILFKIISEEDQRFELSDIKDVVWSIYKNMFGISGTTESGLFYEFFKEDKNIGLVRCTSKSQSSFLSVISMISEIKGYRTIIVPILVAGTIRKAKELLEKIE